jgi:hypothetical protein
MRTIPRIRTYGRTLGWLTVEYETEYWDNEAGDTKVKIGKEYLCSIEGNKQEEFHRELENVINKYRI